MIILIQNRIIVLRAERRWTQEDLAKRLDVTRQTISSIERNKYNLSLRLAFQIANVFETNIENVFSWEDNTERNH
ncbi:helix-turn-helix transcriptional regulator [Liquorilactobacillus ghanensis]|jgi:putative transcriptional regulator|uniref:helix-turn-helix transcriptional regulator n=1 Tax=Liquorilactobacillus ghanensis TaxID=399370 RepID=UPI003B8A5AAE